MQRYKNNVKIALRGLFLFIADRIYLYRYIFGAGAAWLFADWGCRGPGRSVGRRAERAVCPVCPVRAEFCADSGANFVPEGG